MNTFFRDVKYAFKQLRASPTFVITAVLTLALGIGLNTAIFSIVDAIILRPLAFPHADKLVRIEELNSARNFHNLLGSSFPDFIDWREQNHVFSDIAMYHPTRFVLLGLAEARHLDGEVVSSNFFHLLGVNPILGRDFSREDEQSLHPAVVVSHGLWQSQFRSDPEIIGRSLDLGGKLYTVVGVLPATFRFPLSTQEPDLWSIFDPRSEAITNRGAHYIEVIARLKSGVTLTQAKSNMDQIARALTLAYPVTNGHITIGIQSEAEYLASGVRGSLLMLAGAVSFILLIACANITNLSLAWSARRDTECAVRLALGAQRFQIIRQLLTVSTLLSLGGGAAAVLILKACFTALLTLLPTQLTRIARPSVNLHVLAFTFFASFVTGILVGLVPAFRASTTNIATNLHNSRSSVPIGTRHLRLQGSLVVLQVALSILLVIGSSLLIRSVAHLLGANPGFNPRNVLTFDFELPSTYSAAQHAEIYERLIEAYSHTPLVATVGASTTLPFSPYSRTSSGFELEGIPFSPSDVPTADFRAVSSAYFRALQISLIRGRFFTEQDTASAPRVAIVNEEFVRRFLHGEDPIGRRIMPSFYLAPDTARSFRHIVGVVGDVRQRSLAVSAVPEYYVPYSQARMGDPTICIRTTEDPTTLYPAVRTIASTIDKNISIYHIAPLEEYVTQSVSQPRFAAHLLTMFGGLSLILATIGINGIMNLTVSQRIHEIGVRLAVGAQPMAIFRMIVRDGFSLAGIGVVIGILAVLPMSKLLSGLLFGVSALDLPSFIIAVLLIVIASLLATWVPARRAASINPMEALRRE